MGLFDLNIPLLYGKGGKAFLQLQGEIIRDHDNHSFFAWSMHTNENSGLLARAARCFIDCRQIVSRKSSEGRQPFSMTNRGLSMTLLVTPWTADTYLACLDCANSTSEGDQAGTAMFLRHLSEDDQHTSINFLGQSGADRVSHVQF